MRMAQSIHSLKTFTAHFKEVLDQIASSLSVHDRLFRLRQGRSTVWEYAVQFCTLADSSGWNEAALLTAFQQGLNPSVRIQMAIYDDTVGLESFVQKAILICQCLTACTEDQPLSPPPSSAHPAPAPEPMQVDSYHLTQAERDRRINLELCLYCGASGHLLNNCPIHPLCPVVRTVLK